MSQRFEKLYRGDKRHDYGCIDSNVGAEYVCPTPTIGGPYNSNYSTMAHGNPNCSTPSLNMGRLAYQCNDSTRPLQSGGDPEYSKYMLTACGEYKLKTEKCNCKSQDSQPQLSDKVIINNSNYCPHIKYNIARQYGNLPTESRGYYHDLTSPSIGNRSEIGSHNNSYLIPNVMKPGLDKMNYKGRKFSCKQPNWDPSCI